MNHRALRLLACLFPLLSAAGAGAQEFRDIKAGIDGFGTSINHVKTHPSFGDFDHDGDLDLLTDGGIRYDFESALKVFSNDGHGHFTLMTDFHELGDSLRSTAAWADVDKDGRYELITWVNVTRYNDIGENRDTGFVRVYGYDGKRFVPRNDITVPVQGNLSEILFSFADVDGDGYPELLVSAMNTPPNYDPPQPVTRIFKNNAGKSFTDITGSVQGVSDAIACWKDIDQDGDLDLFLTGKTENDLSARVYTFNGAAFEDYASISISTDIEGADWGDVDGDGLADLAVCDGYGSTRIYWNMGYGMTLASTSSLFPDDAVNIKTGSLSFGDVNDDGNVDLVLAGYTNAGPFTKVMQNSGGEFRDMELNLPPFWNSHAQFVDFDKDGSVDLLLAGYSKDEYGKTVVAASLFRNIRGDFQPLSKDVDAIGGKRARWGDFDNDGRLDMVVCGSPPYAPKSRGGCRVYHNDAGNFVRQATPLDDLYGDPELGDYDGDGRLDILLAAASGGLRLFRNTPSGFAEAPLQISGTGAARIRSARFGDYDRDGDLDIVGWGEYSIDAPPYSQCYSGLLRNDGGGKFTVMGNAGLPGLCNGEMQWGDFDRDGDPDLLVAGDTSSYAGEGAHTGVYRNENGAFVPTADRFQGLSRAQVAWGDFDRDGDLDFAVSGTSMTGGVLGTGGGPNVPATVVYASVGGRFEEYYRQPFEMAGGVAWVDFDNDGDLDLVVSGSYFSATLPPKVNLTLVHRNNGQSFTILYPGSFYLPQGALDVGDYDNDGDMDILICGGWAQPHSTGDDAPVTRIFRNQLLAPNAVPSAPLSPRSALGKASATLSWNAAQDAETAPEAMHYNLRIGTASGAADVMAPASQPDGRRLLPAIGNAGHIRTATIQGLAPGTYYWSVQSIDKQMAGSPFSPEQKFILGVPAPALLQASSGPGPGAVTLRWSKIDQPNFQRYYLHYGTAADPVDRLDSVSQAGDTVFTVTGLKNGETYHFRLSAADQGGNAGAYSGELTAVPDGTPPAVPEPVLAVAEDRAVSLSWKAATESDFLAYLLYQRNASGPIVRIDSITDINTVSKRIVDLKNGTPYSFLVVAVDRVGNHSGFSAEAVAIPAYLLTPSAPAIAFGRIPLDGSMEAELRISNASALPVPVDSVKLVNSAFSLPGGLASLPAQAETTLTLRFLPGKPAGGDFTGVLKLYYGGAKVPLEIDLSGHAVGKPYCRIDKITPEEIPWDNSSAISFLATANDSDNAGEGDRITAYLWSSSLAGAIGENASGFTLNPGQLGIGTHTVTLRVVDNEGDTSQAASASVTVKSRKPLVRLDSISPAGLIIRGADHPRFRCTAFDLDEGADAAHDSLHAFALFSTLQGRITGAKDTALDANALSLGLHGFYAVAVDDEGDTSVSDTTWVPVQTDIGMALIVAGTDFNDNRYFYENIAPNCNWAYSKLRQRGFSDSLITYFNPVGWQSIGGDYHENSNIVDETSMTRAKLKERILAYKSRVRNGVPLVMSFIGHGSRTEQNGKFYLSPTEFVTPDSLDAWLDTFNEDADGHLTDTLATPIIVALDFCYSGAFMSKLRSSTQNRMVLTSSSADKQAYFQNGQSFSYAFFKQIGKGGNLAQAWIAGKSWSDANTLIGQDRANPLANADNDDAPNEAEDLALMSQIYIGGSQQDQSPEVRWKDVQADFSAKTRSISVHAFSEGAAPVDTAWFTLFAPDFSYASGAADPFASIAMIRQPDGSFLGGAELDPVLYGDYLVIVYGLSAGHELMPVAKHRPILSALSRIAGIPLHYDLGQNYPNPAIGTTYFPFALTQRGKVSLTVMDMQGRVVRSLADGVMPGGFYLMRWDGRDSHGREMPSGIYSYSLISAEGVIRRKLVWGG